jgi:hypothetical protein
MSGFSKGLAEELLRAITPAPKPSPPEGARLNVHAAVSRFAVLYERIRNAVDYKDEHILRKAAIERILKRQFILERNPEAIARHLLRELIGAKYLPNGVLPESLITDVAHRVRKYLIIGETRIGSRAHMAWLRKVLTVELEELLIDESRDKALVTFLYERLVNQVKIVGGDIDDTNLRLQIYLACYRALLKADQDVLSYKLLRAYMPEWLRPQDWTENPQPIAERLIGVEHRIHQSLTHPFAQKVQRLIKPWAVSLNILRDALVEKPGSAAHLLEKPEELQGVVRRVAERRYGQAKKRLRRGALRATIYLFVTKMVIALAIEVPIEQLWYHHIAMTALAINLLFPPILMFFVGLLIRVQPKENTERLQKNIDALLADKPITLPEIRIRPADGTLRIVLLRIAYGLMFALIFGIIAVFLVMLDFTWVSAVIFLFFLCVVSFFAFRLRQNAKEYVIVDRKESFTSHLMDFISLPILRAGHILSRSISRLNVFLFFFDFIFEAPFKMFLTVLEEWFAFVKEKKEELQ